MAMTITDSQVSKEEKSNEKAEAPNNSEFEIPSSVAEIDQEKDTNVVDFVEEDGQARSEAGGSHDGDETPPPTSTYNISTVISTQLIRFPLNQLPPPQKPRYRTKQKETLGGICFVTLIIGIFVGLTHGVALTLLPSNLISWWIVQGLIYSEAFLAFLCLFAILWVDPGVVPRTTETCYPIPSDVVAWLEDTINKDRPSQLYFPSLEEDNHDTYCTRCLVWRQSDESMHPVRIIHNQRSSTTTTNQHKKPYIKYFHCNICQRCVAHFDHHCGFFGRCIAGELSLCSGTGNYNYFFALLGLGVVGYVTCLASVLAGLVHEFGPHLVVPIFITALLVFHLQMPCFQRIVCALRSTLCCC